MNHQFQLLTPSPRSATVRVELGEGYALPAWFGALIRALDDLEPDHTTPGPSRGFVCSGPARVDVDAWAGELCT